jgi:hypothetical protein
MVERERGGPGGRYAFTQWVVARGLCGAWGDFGSRLFFRQESGYHEGV